MMAAQFAHFRLILASLRLIGAIEGDTFNEGSISGIEQLHDIFTSQPLMTHWPRELMKSIKLR